MTKLGIEEWLTNERRQEILTAWAGSAWEALKKSAKMVLLESREHHSAEILAYEAYLADDGRDTDGCRRYHIEELA